MIALGALLKLKADALPEGIEREDLAPLYTPQSKAWLRRRIAAQVPDEVRLAAATHVIDNNGTLDQLRVRTTEVLDRIEAESPKI